MLSGLRKIFQIPQDECDVHQRGKDRRKTPQHKQMVAPPPQTAELVAFISKSAQAWALPDTIAKGILVKLDSHNWGEASVWRVHALDAAAHYFL